MKLIKKMCAIMKGTKDKSSTNNATPQKKTASK
jgi:hypothetical protein